MWWLRYWLDLVNVHHKMPGIQLCFGSALSSLWPVGDVNLREHEVALDFNSWRQELPPQQDTQRVTELNQQTRITIKAPRGQTIYNSLAILPSSRETLRKRLRTFSANFCPAFLASTEIKPAAAHGSFTHSSKVSHFLISHAFALLYCFFFSSVSDQWRALRGSDSSGVSTWASCALIMYTAVMVKSKERKKCSKWSENGHQNLG